MELGLRLQLLEFLWLEDMGIVGTNRGNSPLRVKVPPRLLHESEREEALQAPAEVDLVLIPRPETDRPRAPRVERRADIQDVVDDVAEGVRFRFRLTLRGI